MGAYVTSGVESAGVFVLANDIPAMLVKTEGDAIQNTPDTWNLVKAAVISYDLDGGTGAVGVSYETEKVQIGSTVTVKAAPTKAGYTFQG